MATPSTITTSKMTLHHRYLNITMQIDPDGLVQVRGASSQQVSMQENDPVHVQPCPGAMLHSA